MTSLGHVFEHLFQNQWHHLGRYGNFRKWSLVQGRASMGRSGAFIAGHNFLFTLLPDGPSRLPTPAAILSPPRWVTISPLPLHRFSSGICYSNRKVINSD